MPITTLPTPPTRQDPTNFADRADTFLAALPTFGTEANALAVEVNGNASTASVAATNAQAAASAAQASAGVTLWNPSTTYTIGQTVYSPTSFYTYRRKLAGMSATDPASDSTNWVQVTGTGNVNTESTTVDMTGTRFSVGGLLGVGTTGPQVKAHFVSTSADVLRLESTSGSAVLSFRTSSTSINPYIRSNTDDIAIFTSGVSRLQLNSDGTVNIGNGTSVTTGALNSFIPIYSISPNNSVVSQFRSQDLGDLYISSYKSDGSSITFNTSTSSGSVTEKVIIKPDGKVGVGVSTPTALVDVNDNTIRLRTARTPASATAAGNQGDVCWDNNYVYVCIATNTWKRTALTTW